MRILYAAMKYDYGQPERGFGFEHYNFYHALVHAGHDILYFDFMSLHAKYGQAGMSRRLAEVVRAEKPDLLFVVLFTDQFDPAVLRDISAKSDTVTLNWFCDDHWRFDNYSCHWAPQFNWVVTTAQSALPKYAAMGYETVIKSQWGCNHALYRKLDLPMKYDVSFVGLPHGNRREIIQFLRDAGISVNVWGMGWESGRLSQDEMIEVFNQSRININLSNASITTAQATGGGSAAVPSWLGRLVRSLPYGANLAEAGKRVLRASAEKGTAAATTSDATPDEGGYVEQIKGRTFEVPGCGGFLLTGMAEDLGRYYALDREVVAFQGRQDLARRIRYFLEHEDERRTIAESGYARTLAEHTYVHRFNDIFRQCGFPHAVVDHQRLPPPGQTIDID